MQAQCPLIVKEYPIDQEVKGMQTIKLLIPIEIPSDFKNEADSDIKVIDMPFAFFGPRAGQFGQQFTVKVQVEDGEFELNLFRAATTLADARMGTFDECVEALRKCNLDENAALMMLVDAKEKSTLM